MKEYVKLQAPHSILKFLLKMAASGKGNWARNLPPTSQTSFKFSPADVVMKFDASANTMDFSRNGEAFTMKNS